MKYLMKCKKCGQQNIEKTRFCSNCGEKLEKKKKSYTFLWIILGIILMITLIFVITKLINRFDDPFDSIDDLIKMEDNTINNTNNYKDITCYLKINENKDDEYNSYIQVKVLFDEQDKINDLYFKGIIQMKNYDPVDYTFKITKKIVSIVLNTMKVSFEKDFQKYKFKTIDEEDKLSVKFRITDGYY